MSLEATVWALKQSPVTDQTQLLVLIGLADHAHADGTAAWPSMDTLAGYARCSVRTVQRHLRMLEEDGVIRRGDQSIIPSRIPQNRRPVVYDINLGGDTVTGAGKPSGVTPGTAWGDTGGNPGVTTVSDKPSFFLTEETILEPSGQSDPPALLDEGPPAIPASVDRDFVEWYEAYPRKIGKQDALRAYKAARRRGVTADQLLQGVRRYPFPSRPHAGQPDYRPHPASWLNKGYWDAAEQQPAQQDAKARRAAQGGITWQR